MHLRRGQSLSIASLWRSLPTASIFEIERLDDSPHQGRKGTTHNPCSAPFFHSSLLAITILAQIADGRNSTLHTTDGILDATTLRLTADTTTTS